MKTIIMKPDTRNTPKIIDRDIALIVDAPISILLRNGLELIDIMYYLREDNHFNPISKNKESLKQGVLFNRLILTGLARILREKCEAFNHKPGRVLEYYEIAEVNWIYETLFSLQSHTKTIQEIRAGIQNQILFIPPKRAHSYLKTAKLILATV